MGEKIRGVMFFFLVFGINIFFYFALNNSSFCV